VSRDLVHWQELPPALAPDELGPVFSGSCVVDHGNVSGLGTGEVPPVLAFYTAASYIRPGGGIDFSHPGRVCLAYSNDRGRSWTRFAGNPILPVFSPGNRDPKVLFHPPSGQWVMLITLNTGPWTEDNRFMMLASEDLRTWDEVWRFDMPTGCDCPDLFELPVDGDPDNTRWVVWSGDTTHMIGMFDGTRFIPEGPVRTPPVAWMEQGSGGYAAQTFVHMPESDRRCIQMSWIHQRGVFPGMPFSQQASFPCELTLRSTDAGVRLHRYPIREIETLHEKGYELVSRTLEPEQPITTPLDSEAFDVDLAFRVAGAGLVTLALRGLGIQYDAGTQELSCAGTSVHLTPRDGRVALRVLVDRCSAEIFGNDGGLVMYYCFPLDPAARGVRLGVERGALEVERMRVHTLDSIWGREGAAPATGTGTSEEP
jgi:sucrose-6-phosphate hydrolase SacC (GH32 family)